MLLLIKELKFLFALKLIEFGIRIYESEPIGLLSPEERKNLKQLWDYWDYFMRKKLEIHDQI